TPCEKARQPGRMEDGVGGAADKAAVEMVAAAGRESDETGAALLRRINDLPGRVSDRDDRFDFYPFVLKLPGRARHKDIGLVDRGGSAGGVCLRLPSVRVCHRRDGMADGD